MVSTLEYIVNLDTPVRTPSRRDIPLTHRFGPPQACLGEEGYQRGSKEAPHIVNARIVARACHVALIFAGGDGSGIVDSVATPAFWRALKHGARGLGYIADLVSIGDQQGRSRGSRSN